MPVLPFRMIVVLALALAACVGGIGRRAAAATAAESRVTYELDVLPILTSAGCNAGACHGKSRGQNGFQLSLLGFDADFDHSAIVKEARGRRVFPAAPDLSLILQKPSGRLSHGGGVRLPVDSEEYKTVRGWIASGMPRRTESDPVLQRIAVAPEERLLSPADIQNLSVTAYYSDGSTRDVTRLASFQSSDSGIVSVDKAGLVKAGRLPGEGTIMVRYMDRFATWRTAIPQDLAVSDDFYDTLPRHSFIDDLVWDKLRKLRITPSTPASDSAFLRRAYLDVIGRLPFPDESRAYLQGSSPDKRAALIDRLLARPEYADFWANKWADLLRPNPYRVGIKATLNYDNWIRGAFRANKPYDEFVRELVTAQGSTWQNGAATLYRDRRSPEEVTTMVSQLFLGVRLECAKCHQHPFEIWGQNDFYSLAAYFARVGRKGPGVSPPISGGEEIVFTAPNGSVSHPTTGKEMSPRPLFGEARQPKPDEDPRQVLAEWMTADTNTYFREVAVNRVWAELMGRGLVDPVDDLRATNPPSNAELLTALVDEFRRQDYDLKKLIRLITTSYVYGLSSLAGEGNLGDTRNYSRYYRTRLRAEVLLDAVSDVTGVPEKFTAMPPGSRATEIWTHRVESPFLDAFDRPNENQDPPCERTSDPTVVQSLHLMNSENLQSKLTDDDGRAAQLAASDRTNREIIEELYLLTYSRFPTDEEFQAVTVVLDETGAKRRQAVEDLLWALINTPEFIFKN
ncbi:MAG: DUF1549 and DUF1553 domain-containing protein [Pirellulales bacterium]